MFGHFLFWVAGLLLLHKIIVDVPSFVTMKNLIMKKIFVLCLFSIVSSVSLYAASPGAPEKIREKFQHQFPQIQNASFFTYKDCYEVYFKKENHSSERIYYNRDGIVTITIKYYSGNELEPFIREKLNKKYKGKTILGITEVQSDAQHFYKIILLGNNNSLYIVKSDDDGSLETEKILKKS